MSQAQEEYHVTVSQPISLSTFRELSVETGVALNHGLPHIPGRDRPMYMMPANTGLLPSLYPTKKYAELLQGGREEKPLAKIPDSLGAEE